MRIPGRSSLVKLYREGLKSLQDNLDLIYRRGVPVKGEVLDLLKAEVSRLIAKRSEIITRNLKRHGARIYRDTLHEAARLCGLKVDLIPTELARDILQVRPKLAPSLRQSIRRHAVKTRRTVSSKIQALSKSDLADQGVVAGKIKDAFRIDLNKEIRLASAEATVVATAGNQIAMQALTDTDGAIGRLIASTGTKFVKVWEHDSPRVPRPYHQDVLDGSIPDKDGLWWHGASSATGPGAWDNPAHNPGCKCSIRLMTVSDYLSKFGLSKLQPWSYLPTGS